MADILGPGSNAPNVVTARPSDARTFGSPDTWIKDCTNSSANDGTALMAGMFNALIGNMRGLARGNGSTAAAAPVVPEDNSSDTLLLRAVQHLIQRGQPLFGVAAGPVNAYTCTLAPAPPELLPGMEFTVYFGTPNTTTSPILTLNSVGAKAVLKQTGTLPAIGDLSGFMNLIYDGAALRVNGPCRSELLIGAVQYFNVNGAFLVPNNVTRIRHRSWGGAGGGGGSNNAGSAGAAGARGGYSEGYLPVTPGAVIPIFVGLGGAGGNPATPTNGAAGGTTSIGSLVTITGGGGGLTAFGAIINSGFAAGGVATGGSINVNGGIGGYGFALSATSAVGGVCQADFGGAGGSLSSGGGAPGVFPAGGGGGGANASAIGGAGAPGFVIIEY